MVSHRPLGRPPSDYSLPLPVSSTCVYGKEIPTRPRYHSPPSERRNFQKEVRPSGRRERKEAYLLQSRPPFPVEALGFSSIRGRNNLLQKGLEERFPRGSSQGSRNGQKQRRKRGSSGGDPHNSPTISHRETIINFRFDNNWRVGTSAKKLPSSQPQGEPLATSYGGENLPAIGGEGNMRERGRFVKCPAKLSGSFWIEGEKKSFEVRAGAPSAGRVRCDKFGGVAGREGVESGGGGGSSTSEKRQWDTKEIPHTSRAAETPTGRVVACWMRGGADRGLRL